MNLNAIFGNVSQQAAWSHTLSFAGLFNFPILLRFAFRIGVSQTENNDILQKTISSMQNILVIAGGACRWLRSANSYLS
jgi:hypothetical protein